MSAFRRVKFRRHARKYLFKKQKGHCFYCYKNFSCAFDIDSTLDHYMPRSSFYYEDKLKDDIKNLVLSCIKCNSEKGNKIPILDKESAWKKTLDINVWWKREIGLETKKRYPSIITS